MGPEMKTVETGDILVQDNQDRSFGADPQYAVVWATVPGELPTAFVFTKEELQKAKERAESNPEDIPELGSEAPVNEWDEE